MTARADLAAPSPEARRARRAVAALFFTNGAAFASLVPRYPDLKRVLELSNTELGSAVSSFWLGALLLGALAGVVVGRWGSGRTAWVMTVVAGGNLALVGLAPGWGTLAAVLFVAGAVDTVADVAENAHALRVERSYGRSVLNSLHGVWSIGAVTGGLAGAAAAGLEVPVAVHLPVAGVVVATLAVAVSRSLLPGPDREPAAQDAPAQPLRRPSRGLVLGVVALGTVATLTQAIEDTGATWSALYLRDALAASPAVAGLGFVALQGMQTVGRLLGDRTVTRFGDRAVGRAGALLAGCGIALALAVPSQASAIAGFGAAGLGIATLIPAAMRAADGVPGLSPGVGLTLVGTVSRVGSLGAPVLVGVLADLRGLRVALLAVPLAAVALLLLSPSLPGRSRPNR